MRTATRLLLGALAFVLLGTAAQAQNDVTFQVDMSPYIASCQFNPATHTVTTPGSMNGWGVTQYPLTDPDNNGIYTGTYSVAAGEIKYKFHVGGNQTLNWEQTSDRAYTVVAGAQSVPVVTFAGPTPTNVCSATSKKYTLTFLVDMSVQMGRGAFNPATQRVAVTGGFNGWGAANAWYLTEDSGTSGLYSGTFDYTFDVPTAQEFKFIITNQAGTEVQTWDTVNPVVTPDTQGGNRIIRLTGSETDADGDGDLDYLYDNDTNSATFPYFADQDASQFLTAPATVTINLDARAAQYLLATGAALPIAGGTTIDRVAINGPIIAESQQTGGPGAGETWVAWNEVLNSTATHQLTKGADNQWSITLNYAAGAARQAMGKFGINGSDNESAGGDAYNHVFRINEGANTFNLSFGCMQRYDLAGMAGRAGYIDETDGGAFAFYDEYLRINNTANPATCVTVASGGVAADQMAVAGESGPQIAGLTIGAAYPNPVVGHATVDLTLDRAMAVTARLYDVTGRQVAALVQGSLAAGTTPVAIDAGALSAGVYVLRVEADGQAVTRRLTVVR